MRLSVLLVAGCSLGLTRPPAEPAQAGDVPDCTTSGMLPSFDTLAALSNAGTGVVAAVQGNAQIGATSLAIGAVYAAFAAYGWHTVHACRRAKNVAVHGLTTEASASVAAAGGCSHVLEIAVRLAQDAPDAYVDFIHDPAVASCF